MYKNKNAKLIILSAGSALAMALNGSAASVVFDLLDQSRTVDIERGEYAVDGVTMSMIASSGSLNQTNLYFGINHAVTGDDTDQIDSHGEGGAETLRFSFDTPGVLTQIQMSSFVLGDLFELRKNGNLILSLSDQGLSSPETFNLSEGYGEVDDFFTLTYLGGNGASLDAVVVNAVPEPSSLCLIAIGALTCSFRRRR